MKERTAFVLFSAGVIALTLATAVVLSMFEASSQQIAMACVVLICLTASAAANLVIHYNR